MFYLDRLSISLLLGLHYKNIKNVREKQKHLTWRPETIYIFCYDLGLCCVCSKCACSQVRARSTVAGPILHCLLRVCPSLHWVLYFTVAVKPDILVFGCNTWTGMVPFDRSSLFPAWCMLITILGNLYLIRHKLFHIFSLILTSFFLSINAFIQSSDITRPTWLWTKYAYWCKLLTVSTLNSIHWWSPAEICERY